MQQQLRQHIEEIVSLTDEEFEQIFAYFSSYQLKKHQFLVQEGQDVHHEYFVVNGLLKSVFTNEEGKEHIVQFAMENWWITDYQAYFKRGKATLNIDCIEPVQLLGLSHENKQKLCASSHKMEHFFMVKVTSGFVALQQRVLTLLNSNAQARYEQLINQYPLLAQRVPKAVMAAYLGVSRETLSRLNS
ncbi:Crp/Fnr family transcriptional regulator [uncultured Chitinophaga sp.]|uniref:Crp/Fnr family transcriptional regulator n=1 Tax=uncultured Chitinophaga sp. TaxID=339340 RepID=UPI0025F2B5F6|nr:Crp/Fnr family transcriptional regulator [uncultured Chitinophaga sp.]